MKIWNFLKNQFKTIGIPAMIKFALISVVFNLLSVLWNPFIYVFYFFVLLVVLEFSIMVIYYIKNNLPILIDIIKKLFNI